MIALITISSCGGNSATPSDTAKEWIELIIEKKGGIDSYSILSKTIAEDGKTAKVEYEIVYGNGKKDKQSFDMVLIDGKWKQRIKK